MEKLTEPPAETESQNWQDLLHAKTRAKHARAYDAWTDQEDEQLVHEYHQGLSIAELMRVHGRTRGAIRSRLKKLKFISYPGIQKHE